MNTCVLLLSIVAGCLAVLIVYANKSMKSEEERDINKDPHLW